MNKITHGVEVILFRRRFLLTSLYMWFTDMHIGMIADKREFQGTHS
jgi:hypothetical protein